MNESIDSKDVVALLKKMQKKLEAVEEKIDALVLQSKRQTFQDRPFSKSRKEYNKPSRPGERKFAGKKKEEASSEGKFYHGLPFGKKKDSGKSSFKKTKKSFKKR
ncbi:MAG: hypothetical protein KAR32_06610 [Candidatus Omnitrophica bacterium]|nr:hypothetical protein [Candidatus Omnitrophota bacterium]